MRSTRKVCGRLFELAHPCPLERRSSGALPGTETAAIYPSALDTSSMRMGSRAGDRETSRGSASEDDALIPWDHQPHGALAFIFETAALLFMLGAVYFVVVALGAAR